MPTRPVRKIIHVDMDAFFAAVEQHDNPELRGKPIAVGHGDGRGVVATASYEARRFGVHSAMPAHAALALCPDLVFVPSRMERYQEVSHAVMEILARHTDLVEQVSIDEAFLDVTKNRRGIPLAVDIARAIKADIRAELGLTASAGVSYNKFLAKIASDWRKPDGLCTIHPDQALEFLDRLPVDKIWGVGPVTAQRMHNMGIVTAAHLRAADLSRLTHAFGKAGWDYHQYALGVDNRPVTNQRERKSVGCEHTFETDIRDRPGLLRELRAIVPELLARVEDKRFSGCTLTLKMRLADFSTVTRSLSRAAVWQEHDEILDAGVALADEIDRHGLGIRLLGLSVSNQPLALDQLAFDLPQSDPPAPQEEPEKDREPDRAPLPPMPPFRPRRAQLSLALPKPGQSGDEPPKTPLPPFKPLGPRQLKLDLAGPRKPG